MTKGLKIVENLSIVAVIEGEWATLLDRRGMQIGKARILLERITGAVNPDMITRHLWDVVLRKKWFQLGARVERRAWLKNHPWHKWAANAYGSLRLRSRLGYSKPKRRAMKDPYDTHFWHQAFLRLITQYRNAFNKAKRDKWLIWTQTVSQNHRRKHKAYLEMKNNGKDNSDAKDATCTC